MTENGNGSWLKQWINPGVLLTGLISAVVVGAWVDIRSSVKDIQQDLELVKERQQEMRIWLGLTPPPRNPPILVPRKSLGQDEAARSVPTNPS